MTLITFGQVFTVCLLGAISPGPSMAVVINNAIFKGKIHGFLTSIGHGVGIAVYAIFAVLGIGLMIKTNLILFNFLKVLSVMFLIFIGVKAIINKEKFNLETNTIKGNMISSLQGFSIAILNPKIFIWFVAIYSQFMSVNNKLMFNLQLVLIAGIIDTLWYMALTFIVTTAPAQYFFQSKINIIKKIQGYFFLAIGSGLMFELLIKNFF